MQNAHEGYAPSRHLHGPLANIEKCFINTERDIKMNFLIDQPIDKSEKDQLLFNPYATSLKNVIENLNGSITIGIFGEWGSGKTSLMKLVNSELSNSKNLEVVTVWFNAWQYEKEAHPVIPLVRLLAKSLVSKRETAHPLGRVGEKIFSSLKAILMGLKISGKLGFSDFAEVGLEFDPSKVKQEVEKIDSDGLGNESLYSAIYESLGNAKLRVQQRIVIFIDDLDRCSPKSAFELLESIKLAFSHPGFSFVLGVANNILEGFIDYKYNKKYGLMGTHGKQYLDKIIQLQFQIPPNKARVPDLTKSFINQFDDSIKNKFLGLIDIISSAGLGNPRKTIRFINYLLIDSAINEELAKIKEVEPIDLGYYAVTRALQLEWPEIYNRLISSSYIRHKISTWDQEDIYDPVWHNQFGKLDETSTLAKKIEDDIDLASILFSQEGKNWLIHDGHREAAITFLLQHSQNFKSPKIRSSRLYDLFFSYKSDQKQTISKIAQIMGEEGIRIMWWDDFKPGVNWRKATNDDLGNSKGMVSFVSKGMEESPWLSKELALASELSAKDPSFRIYPVLLPDSTESQVPEKLKEWIWLDLREVDFSDNRKITDALRPLIEHVKNEF